MDALLQIAVPELVHIDGLEIVQPFYELEDVKYPQGPKVVTWKDVTLSFEEPESYPKRFLPAGYSTENWIWLKVSDETLDRYDIWVKKSGDEGDINPALETFLRILLRSNDKWLIGFLEQFDQIDSVYRLNSEEVIAKIRSNLMRDTISEGFIAYS